jgi:hypothetical protein
MNKKEQLTEDFNSLNILHFIYKWRNPLIIIGIATFVISSIVALTIREKYKSQSDKKKILYL